MWVKDMGASAMQAIVQNPREIVAVNDAKDERSLRR
jgi:hypothetical protein